MPNGIEFEKEDQQHQFLIITSKHKLKTGGILSLIESLSPSMISFHLLSLTTPHPKTKQKVRSL